MWFCVITESFTHYPHSYPHKEPFILLALAVLAARNRDNFLPACGYVGGNWGLFGEIYAIFLLALLRSVETS